MYVEILRVGNLGQYVTDIRGFTTHTEWMLQCCAFTNIVHCMFSISICMCVYAYVSVYRLLHSLAAPDHFPLHFYRGKWSGVARLVAVLYSVCVYIFSIHVMYSVHTYVSFLQLRSAYHAFFYYL